ncbi:MAG: hypothetical protein WAL12_09965 [Trebonia sp.]|jgi:hypothetical protein
MNLASAYPNSDISVGAMTAIAVVAVAALARRMSTRMSTRKRS